MHDFTVERHGSLYVVRPMSPEAAAWMDDHIDPEAHMIGDGVVVEHRFIKDIVVGMIEDGLTVA